MTSHKTIWWSDDEYRAIGVGIYDDNLYLKAFVALVHQGLIKRETNNVRTSKRLC